MKKVIICSLFLMVLFGINFNCSAETRNAPRWGIDSNGDLTPIPDGAGVKISGDLTVLGSANANLTFTDLTIGNSLYIDGTGNATITSGTDLIVFNDNVDINGDCTVSNLASGTGVVYFATANSDGKLSRSALAYPGGVGGTGTNYFTDGGALTYLTSTTDDVAFGGNDTNASFYFDESAGNVNIDGTLDADVGVTAAANIQLTANNLTMTGFSSFNQQGATFKFYSDSNKIVELTKTGNSGIEATIYGDLSTSGVNYVQKDLTLKGNLFISSALTATGAGTGPTTYIRTKIGNTWYKLTAVRE